MRSILLLSSLLVSCKGKNGTDGDGPPTPPDPTTTLEPWDALPIGDPVSASIGPTGGSITSADGRLVLDFPPDAVAADTLVGVQQVEWPGGYGWSLTPEGETFAVPVNGTVTLEGDEAGPPVFTTVDDVTEVELPLLDVAHIVLDDGPGELVETTTTVSEPDLAVETAFDLSHFSIVGTEHGPYLTATHSVEAFVGNSVTARWTYPEAPRQVSVTAYCPERETVWTSVEVTKETDLTSLTVNDVDTTILSAVGPVRPYSDGTWVGQEQEFTCQRAGFDVISLVGTVIKHYSNAPVGCIVRGNDASHTLSLSAVRVTCLDAAICTFTDPNGDLLPSGPPADPALDLTCIYTGQTVTGEPWVRVAFDGPWPPSAAYFSFFSTVTFGTDSGTGTFTTEHHLEYSPSDYIVTGGVLAAETWTYTELEDGFLVILDGSWSDRVTSVSVTSGLLKVPPPQGVFTSDQLPGGAFDATVAAP